MLILCVACVQIVNKYIRHMQIIYAFLYNANMHSLYPLLATIFLNVYNKLKFLAT